MQQSTTYLLTDLSSNQDERELVNLYKQLRAVGRAVRSLNPTLGNELDAISDGFIQASAQLLTTDPLTQIPNMRAIINRLPVEALLAQRYADHPLSCIIMDGKGFGRLNNELGHVYMNQALTKWCQTLQREVRPSDLLARLGGDELICLAPNTTTDEALGLAERLCKAAGSCSFKGRFMPLYAGIATLLPSDDDSMAIIARADAALYVARATDGASIVIWSPEMGFSPERPY